MILSDNVDNKVCILPLVREQQGYELQLNTNIFRRTFPLQQSPENGDFSVHQVDWQSPRSQSRSSIHVR